MMSTVLKPSALALLQQWPEEFTKKAEEAVSEGKAFCPSCHFAGILNCGYFDECDSFIMPSGRKAR